MFAFSQIDPETRGQVAAPKVPLSRYLGANWGQGDEDSAFRSVEKITEMGLADPDSPGLLESATMSLNEIADRSAPKISAEEANNKYSLPGLTFERPVIEAQAKLINERRRAELERSYYLDDADTNPLRWTTGMGARIAGGMMNPLDLGINFMPIVGSEKAAANVLGRGTREGASTLEQLLARPRAALARGLIPEESLTHLPAPHFTASLINGAIGQAAFEVPVAIAKMQELQDYNASDFAEAVLGGAAFAGALHVALAGAGRLFRRLRPETREVMLRKAVDDFVKGDNISVHDLVTIDDNAIRDKVKWDPQRVRAEAEDLVNKQMPELEKAVREKYGEHVVSAAVKLPDGTVHEGLIHPLVWDKLGMEADSFEANELDEGFVTNKGRFIDRAEAAELTGKSPETTVLAGVPPFGTPEFIALRNKLIVLGKIDPDTQVGTEQMLTYLREQQSQATSQGFEQALKTERQKAIKRFIEKKRREFDPDKAFSDEVRAEIQRQVAEGKVVGPEASKKYGATDLVSASDIAKVEEDVKELERQLGADAQISGKDLPDLVPSSTSQEYLQGLFKQVTSLSDEEIAKLKESSDFSDHLARAWGDRRTAYGVWINQHHQEIRNNLRKFFKSASQDDLNKMVNLIYADVANATISPEATIHPLSQYVEHIVGGRGESGFSLITEADIKSGKSRLALDPELRIIDNPNFKETAFKDLSPESQDYFFDLLKKIRDEADPNERHRLAMQYWESATDEGMTFPEQLQKYLIPLEPIDEKALKDVKELERQLQMKELGISDEDIAGKDLPDLDKAIDAGTDCIIQNGL